MTAKAQKFTIKKNGKKLIDIVMYMGQFKVRPPEDLDYTTNSVNAFISKSYEMIDKMIDQIGPNDAVDIKPNALKMKIINVFSKFCICGIFDINFDDLNKINNVPDLMYLIDKLYDAVKLISPELAEVAEQVGKGENIKSSTNAEELEEAYQLKHNDNVIIPPSYNYNQPTL